NNRLQISAQRNFDRRDEILIYIEICNQSAGERSLDSRLVMQPFEHSLRPLRETFALLVKLTQNFKARFFFRPATLNCGELFFHACHKLLVLSQLLAASLNSCSPMIEFEVLGRRAYSGDLVLDASASAFCVRNGVV